MFRNPRQVGPSAEAAELGRVLEPLPTFLWGPLALYHLGVPIGGGFDTIVVRDEDYQIAIRKLLDSEFVSTVPNRTPAPEVMEDLPDPQSVLAEINEGYKSLDLSSTVFNYPSSYPETGAQLFLIPNSFAHLPLIPIDSTSNATGPRPTVPTSHYNVYKNLFYPLEEALVESLVKVAVDEEKKTDISTWGELMKAWIAMMVGYLDVNNDILDMCEDEQAIEWYSVLIGQKYEAVSGPIDRRITKRLGSGKEMSVDMRGNPVVGD